MLILVLVFKAVQLLKFNNNKRDPYMYFSQKMFFKENNFTGDMNPDHDLIKIIPMKVMWIKNH